MKPEAAGAVAGALWADLHLPWMMLLDDVGKVVSVNASMGSKFPPDSSPAGRLLQDAATGDCAPQDWQEGRDLPLILNAGPGRLTTRWSWRRLDSGFLLVRLGTEREDAAAMAELGRLHIEMADLNRELHRKIKELEAAREEIQTLSGLLPICMYCKNIRNDDGYWEKVEAYIFPRADVQFSHSICDKCMSERFSEEEDA